MSRTASTSISTSKRRSVASSTRAGGKRARRGTTAAESSDSEQEIQQDVGEEELVRTQEDDVVATTDGPRKDKELVVVSDNACDTSSLTTVATLFSTEKSRQLCRAKRNRVFSALKDYIRDNAWAYMKFAPNNLARERLFRQAMKAWGCGAPEGVSERMFMMYYYDSVSTVFSSYRHNAQTCARSRYLKGMQLPAGNKKKVPENFPDKVMIQVSTTADEGKKTYSLPPGYRKELTPEFKYFVEYIVTALDGQHCNFQSHKRQTDIDELFTVSHEAYALLMLYNEFECWNASHQKLKNPDGTPKRISKKFTGSNTGDKRGMTGEGLRVYEQLYREITQLRKTEQSKAVVRQLREEYNNSGSRRVNYVDESTTEDSKWDVETTVPKDCDIYKICYSDGPMGVETV